MKKQESLFMLLKDYRDNSIDDCNPLDRLKFFFNKKKDKKVVIENFEKLLLDEKYEECLASAKEISVDKDYHFDLRILCTKMITILDCHVSNDDEKTYFLI